jgi:hypothetical protein
MTTFAGIGILNSPARCWRWRYRWLAPIAALAVGCESPTGPFYTEELGFIAWNEEPFEVLALPPSAAAGADFTITVRTFGDGCTTGARTVLRYEGNLAIVTPYDNHVAWLPPNMACPSIIASPVHTVALRFATPGVAQVRVEGRRYPSLETAVVTGTLATQ